jgi:hypothetical protein
MEQTENSNVENFNANFAAANKLNERKVFIPNQGGHDFSKALRYGTLVYVTKGLVNRFSVNVMARMWASSLKSSTKEDYLLLTSLTILSVVGAAIFGYLHGGINLLIYRNDNYIARHLDFKSLFADP